MLNFIKQKSLKEKIDKLSLKVERLVEDQSSLNEKIDKLSLKVESLVEDHTFFNLDQISLEQVESLPLNEKKCVLFNYPYAYNHKSLCMNLGDYIQTIAVERALNQYRKDLSFDYFDRDNLQNYYPSDNANMSSLAIMQGFFWGGGKLYSK